MLSFEWDLEKAENNYRKHGVSFETAQKVFGDPYAREDIDPLSSEYGEERILITGHAGGRVLTVIYTERGECIRIISARRATKKEHDDYYCQNPED